MTERTYNTVDKSSWGDGPWQGEPDKVQYTDEATGLPCLAVRAHLGNWCGYVGVAEGHPLFGVGYDQCPRGCAEWGCCHRPDGHLDVHGGITYAAACQEGDEARSICHVPEPGQPDHVWWFGWDCAHADDLVPGLAARLLAGRAFLKGMARHETYRNLEFVREQNRQLAAQLAGRQP